MLQAENKASNAGAQNRASLKNRAIGAVKWTVLSELAARVFPPLTTVILARLLTPEDYGVVGVAAITLSLLNIVWEAGMGRALIQTEQDLEKGANCVFWSNLSISFVVYGLLFISAPQLGYLFHDDRIAAVLRVFGVTVILGAASTVHLVLLQRELRYKPIFWGRFLTSVIPGLVSIPLAIHGSAHWALVIGSVVGSAAYTCFLWKASPWRPKLRIDWSESAALWRFGIWTLGESLLGWFYTSGDSAFLGAFLNVTDLGVYRTGTTFVTLVFATAVNPMVPVVYSTLCRLQSDTAAFVAYLTKAIKILSTIALPAGIGLFLLGEDVARVIYGPKWVGLGQVIGIIGLVQGYTTFISGVTYDGYKALGRPDVFPKLMLGALLYYIPVYLLSVSKGLMVFTWARAAAAPVTLPIHLFLMHRLLGLEWGFIWKLTWPQWLSCALMSLVVLGAKNWLLPTGAGGLIGLASLLSSILIGASAYAIATWWFDRPFFRQVLNLTNKALKPGAADGK